jgi:hypothetical protein
MLPVCNITIITYEQTCTFTNMLLEPDSHGSSADKGNEQPEQGGKENGSKGAAAFNAFVAQRDQQGHAIAHLYMYTSHKKWKNFA